jgi:PAS domain S-box-containing protein
MVASRSPSQSNYDLARFALRHMIECGRVVRSAAEDTSSMESAARAIVRSLYLSLVNTEDSEPNCALVRCFKTHRFGQLPPELAEAATAMIQRQPSPEVPCLTLLATAGELPEWNDRRQSRGHAAIPLATVEIVERAPMIASLLRQMGLELEAALYPHHQLVLDADQHTFNVFHVEHAEGDLSIPAQRHFVQKYGIRSVLGFGGLLPSGDLFAVILFSKVRIARETASLFRTIALGVKLALLPHTRGQIFDLGEPANLTEIPATENLIRVARDEQLRSESATLQLLITALEDAALKQTMQLQSAYDELKVQAEVIRNREERLRLAQQTARMASWDWDLETDDVIWDEGSAQTYGRAATEMHSMEQIFTYIHEDDRDRVRADLAPAMIGRGEYRSNFRVCWPDGSLHWIQAFGETIFTGDKPTRIVGINLDVTERRVAEQALIQSEKLAAVGRLASSIAHEINNPLEAVTNLLYLAGNSGDMEAVQRYLTIADVELRRVSAIANQTLRFNKQSTRPTNVTCSYLIGSALAIYQSRINNSNIAVEQRKGATRPILCFEGEIRQVISSLIVNAIDAMPHGGRLLLRSREGRQWKSGRKGLLITVADTGSGISKESSRKIFEAFYTTKGIGGTGLGLWISREILDRHEGTLSVRSSQNGSRTGCVFVIFLPSVSTISSTVTQSCQDDLSETVS